ncbi:nucleoid-associated protein [Mesobacillus maritimus]|uniref:nucleoid-associated protein n=1 Tax=Mesobacillus maritimus TaxID=1643336 RepID=UPI003850CC82
MVGITIKKMIAHYMDLNQDKPTLVDRIIDIEKEDSKIISFFSEHIEKALTTKQIKICIFQTDKAAVYMDCLDISKKLEDDDCFIGATADMTARLFDYMKSSTSKSSGTMIYMIYENDSNGRIYLGILKMDPNEGIEFDPLKYSFKVRYRMLPTVKEKLHKTAFVKLGENVFSEESHLYVLDKQQSGDGVSKFFMYNFLEAEEVLNDKKMTKIIDETLMDYAVENKIAEGIKPLDFKQEVDKLLSSGKEFDFDNDVDNFLKSYVPGEEDRDKLIEDLKQSIRSKNEDSYFQFTVVKESTMAYVNNAERSIRIQFPLSLKDKNVFIETFTDDDGKKVTKILIKGEEMHESYK